MKSPFPGKLWHDPARLASRLVAGYRCSAAFPTSMAAHRVASTWGTTMKKLHLLLDIDGTLILTGGAGQQAMGDAVAGRQQTQEWKEEIAFAGRTDRSIFLDFFRLYEVAETEANLTRYAHQYSKMLAEYLATHVGQVMPGVVEALECWVAHEQVHVGLLTGNLRQAAMLKLKHYGLANYFVADRRQVVGGFGDRHVNRDDVAREALSSAREHWHPQVDPSDVWVVGDTPNDIRCARAIGANVVAVATGGSSMEELASHAPDFTVPDLHRADEWWSHLATEYGVRPPRPAGAG